MLTREPSFRRASTIGLEFIDPPSDRRGDPLADVHQMRLIAEMHVGQRHLAALFDEGAVRSVDHDVGDAVVLQQRLQRSQAGDVVHQFVGQHMLLAARSAGSAGRWRFPRPAARRRRIRRSAGIAATTFGSSRDRQALRSSLTISSVIGEPASISSRRLSGSLVGLGRRRGRCACAAWGWPASAARRSEPKRVIMRCRRSKENSPRFTWRGHRDRTCPGRRRAGGPRRPDARCR